MLHRRVHLRSIAIVLPSAHSTVCVLLAALLTAAASRCAHQLKAATSCPATHAHLNSKQPRRWLTHVDYACLQPHQAPARRHGVDTCNHCCRRDRTTIKLLAALLSATAAQCAQHLKAKRCPRMNARLTSKSPRRWLTHAGNAGLQPPQVPTRGHASGVDRCTQGLAVLQLLALSNAVGNMLCLSAAVFQKCHTSRFHTLQDRAQRCRLVKWLLRP